ncbi:MAG: hypothetical protein CME71_12265 [Halobacteriovorax sp.]|nr:hypothetical protein [Halobacteriovorax sp.]|tara:strand:- start:314 stop:658 length:345 start_codon:yes stop_codon:yes gene_type:complete
MKALFFSMIIASSFNVFAASELFEFSGEEHKLAEVNNRLVSEFCQKKDCIAKSVKVAKGKALDGEDPASVACLETMGGTPFQMHDGKKNEESVCVFKDGSVLTFGSIRAELYLK